MAEDARGQEKPRVQIREHKFGDRTRLPLLRPPAELLSAYSMPTPSKSLTQMDTLHLHNSSASRCCHCHLRFLRPGSQCAKKYFTRDGAEGSSIGMGTKKQARSLGLPYELRDDPIGPSPQGQPMPSTKSWPRPPSCSPKGQLSAGAWGSGSPSFCTKMSLSLEDKEFTSPPPSLGTNHTLPNLCLG